MNVQNCKRVVYQLHGLPAGMFGEAYVVVTGIELASNVFRSEQFILTQRPTEAMEMDAFEIDGKSFPAELGKVDVDFALDEGISHAESLVGLLLERRANELERPDLALLPVKLTTRPSPFVGCKMRGQFVEQFAEMRNATKCLTFSSYLKLLDQVGITRRA